MEFGFLWHRHVSLLCCSLLVFQACMPSLNKECEALGTECVSCGSRPQEAQRAIRKPDWDNRKLRFREYKGVVGESIECSWLREEDESVWGWLSTFQAQTEGDFFFFFFWDLLKMGDRHGLEFSSRRSKAIAQLVITFGCSLHLFLPCLTFF